MQTGKLKNLLHIIISLLFAGGLIYVVVFDKDYTIYVGDILRRFITIPVFYWLIGFFYLILYSFLFREKVLRRLRDFVQFMLFSNIVLLVLTLINQFNLHSLLGHVYTSYAMGYASLLAFLFSFYIAIKIEDRFFMPGLIIVAYAACLLWWSGLYLFSIVNILIFFIVALKKNREKLEFFTDTKSIKNILSFLSKYTPLFIFVFAFAVRAIFSFMLIKKLGMDYLIASDDGPGFDGLALLFSKGTVTPFFDTLYEGGYWLFLGTLYKIFGRNFYIVTLIQSMLGATIPVVVYLISKKYFIKSSALACGVSVSLDIMLIHLSAVLGMEALFLPALTFGIYSLMKYAYVKGIKARVTALSIGLMFGVVAASRIILFPFIFIGVLWIFVKKKDNMLRFIGDVFLIFLMAILIHAPILIKNYNATGKILISNLSKRGPQHYSIQNEKLISLGINPFKAPLGSVKNIAEKPKESLKAIYETIGPRMIKMGFSSYFGTFDPIFLINPRGTPNKFAQTVEFYVYIFLIIGLLSSFRFNHGESYFVLSFILYTVFIYSFFYILNARYRAPIVPFLHLYTISGLFFSLGLKQ
ncbi:MAG: hypothetical protein KAU58_01620 [Candidatus Omnitrophica bacterium]|nr:hypothetical protein [Candidatus Omnitrophota bacterium]